ncbi:DMT family transporter [Vallitaleaceae bacterium 9-2]
MKKMISKADLMLLLVAIIWGSGFIATEYAINANMQPMLIMAFRFPIASIALLIGMRGRIKTIKKKEWIRGGIAGVILFLAFYFQTIGQSMTTVSNSAFITATNVVIVPFIVWGLTRKKPQIKTVILAIVTFLGVAVLTVSPEGKVALNIGDAYVMACAILFALHIAYLGIAVRESKAMTIAFIQITVAGIFSLIGLVFQSPQTFTQVDYATGLPAVIYLGLFSTCLCYFLQTSAQKQTTASKAGIIMSMESLFGTLFSIAFGLELLTGKVVIGGMIILTAVILTEVKLNNNVKQVQEV